MIQRAAEAALAMALASVLMGWQLRRSRTFEPRVGRGRFGGLNLAAVVSVVLAGQVAVAFFLYGIEASWYIPDLDVGFKYALDLLQLMIAAFGAPAWAVLTAAVAYRPVPEGHRDSKPRARSRRSRRAILETPAGKP